MITDTEARKIASEWHGGGGTALYAFASTGAIDTARNDHDIEREILDCANTFEANPLHPDYQPLASLLRYIDNQGKRGPQPGWGDLTW